MEECVGKKRNDKNDRLDDETKAACPDDTTPDDMEVGAGDKKWLLVFWARNFTTKIPSTSMESDVVNHSL